MADEKKYTLKTAPLDVLLEKRSIAQSENNFNAVRQFNQELKERFDYTDPTPPEQLPIAEQEGGFLQKVREQAPDLGSSLASGLYRGAAQVADFPADVAQLATTGIEAGTKFLTGKPPSESVMSGITAGMEALPIVGDIRKYSGAVAGAAERAAINTPVQGSAADLIKLAMLKIDRILRTDAYEARMILQVHDELVFEVPLAELDALQAAVVHEMENVYPLSVPLIVSAASGTNWNEAH